MRVVAILRTNIGWADKWTEGSPEEKSLKILVVEKLHLSQHCVLLAQKDSSVLSCIKTSMISCSREVILPVYSSHRRPY